MRWYNYLGILVIIADIIGGILGWYGIIFPNTDFSIGAALFTILLGCGLVLLTDKQGKSE